ncbi:hypothetical protein K3888_14765 [Dietzia aurantiaca]|uniref:rolling circle replication-associated protein n=1 Tax=Dietzia aurantiaca TaxID=983873 RepID=UPI001E57C2D8|nr:hypothetical protein [Dietzia aurantiaca]MCD2263960.1 hypothetical protein [Dietzia aurantiaca]
MSSANPLAVLARPDAGWWLTLYPTDGEAGGSFVPSYRPKRSSWIPGTPAADPERSRAEAARRARGKVRRYCTVHRLNRLGTLTYRGQGCHDPAALRTHIGQFFRALRTSTGRGAFPYVWVPEWHKTDHGMHAHFAIGQYTARHHIQTAWPHGFVHIKRLSDLPVGSTSLTEARVAAGYLSKYVTKSFGEDELSRSMRLHRYEVAQGFQPPAIRLSGRSPVEVLGLAVEKMGRAPAESWSSDETADWQGPPAVWFAWD